MSSVSSFLTLWVPLSPVQSPGVCWTYSAESAWLARWSPHRTRAGGHSAAACWICKPSLTASLVRICSRTYIGHCEPESACEASWSPPVDTRRRRRGAEPNTYQSDFATPDSSVGATHFNILQALFSPSRPQRLYRYLQCSDVSHCVLCRMCPIQRHWYAPLSV